MDKNYENANVITYLIATGSDVMISLIFSHKNVNI